MKNINACQGNWQPTATISNLRLRAAIIAKIRGFFTNLGYMEVETPIMARHGGSDVYLENIKAVFRGREYFLQTSPEYHMKRLLAADSGPIFQIFRAFRDDELGRWHNPEFTLLEWYKLTADYNCLISEVDDFLQYILACKPAKKVTYQQVFIEACGIDPFAVSLTEIRQLLPKYNLDNVLDANEEDLDQYLFLLMSHVVEPFLEGLQNPVIVCEFPPSQASLAKVVQKNRCEQSVTSPNQLKNVSYAQQVAQRFEVYYQGIELANGFAELTDANVQRQRFIKDNLTRKAKGLKEVALDEFFLASLQHGLPECCGVALGIDRLIALALKKNNLASIMAYVIDNA